MGYSSASSSTSSTSSAATTKSATPTEATSTTTSSSTLTLTSPTPSFTGTLISGTVECPDDNGSVYVSSGSSKPFNIECGRDYNSRDGAKDMSNKPIASMAGCIDYCGSTSGCVGVGWGNYQGTITCWLKSELGEPNESDSWYFARLQDLGN
ncbi:hypothetical protein BJ170DRAFT_622687 [Xylariales sp. AK1849]|nr:hypothetical protein BJ170DRAFT_622687 [Xylariales sp. AK1849]